MKFYALVILKTRNILPTQLRLMYIGANEDLTYSPTERELQIFAGKLEKLWQEIVHAARTGEFQPKPTRLCPWCAHQSICPAQGGTAPKYLGWPQLEAQLNANEQ
jgi:putative RecB family exonuclease